MKALGKKVEYNTTQRNPDLLEAESRSVARETYGYVKDTWDTGWDVWHCYETMFDTPTETVTGITKLVFPASNENIVESKSLKLYMFSLQSDVFENTKDFETIVKKELSEAITGDVHVRFFPNDKAVYSTKEEYSFYTPLLRSNCKITGQPDYGDLFVVTDVPFDANDVVPLLDKLSDENHFHEECVEMIFQELEPKYNQLSVSAKYTRRGGIDIWPYRSKGIVTHPKWTKPKKLTRKTFRG